MNCDFMVRDRWRMVVTGSTVGFHRCLKLRRRFAATFQRSEPVIVSFSIRNLGKGKVKFNWIWTRKVKFVFGCSEREKESENLGSSCFGLSIKNNKNLLFLGSVQLSCEVLIFFEQSWVQNSNFIRFLLLS